MDLKYKMRIIVNNGPKVFNLKMLQCHFDGQERPYLEKTIAFIMVNDMKVTKTPPYTTQKAHPLLLLFTIKFYPAVPKKPQLTKVNFIKFIYKQKAINTRNCIQTK